MARERSRYTPEFKDEAVRSMIERTTARPSLSSSMFGNSISMFPPLVARAVGSSTKTFTPRSTALLPRAVNAWTTSLVDPFTFTRMSTQTNMGRRPDAQGKA